MSTRPVAESWYTKRKGQAGLSTSIGTAAGRRGWRPCQTHSRAAASQSRPRPCYGCCCPLGQRKRWCTGACGSKGSAAGGGEEDGQTAAGTPRFSPQAACHEPQAAAAHQDNRRPRVRAGMQGSTGVPARNVVVVGSSCARVLVAAAAQSPGSPPPNLLIKFVGVRKGDTATPKRRTQAGRRESNASHAVRPALPTQRQARRRRPPPLRSPIARPRSCRPHWSPPPPRPLPCWRR